MDDIEKVIKGLESCKHPFCQTADCPYAPWDRDLTCKDELFDDALELLKEQEAEIERLKRELHSFGDLFHTLSDKTEKVIKEQPQIVRCKDCKFNHVLGCSKYCIPHGGDWFCADGERK